MYSSNVRWKCRIRFSWFRIPRGGQGVRLRERPLALGALSQPAPVGASRRVDPARARALPRRRPQRSPSRSAALPAGDLAEHAPRATRAREGNRVREAPPARRHRYPALPRVSRRPHGRRRRARPSASAFPTSNSRRDPRLLMTLDTHRPRLRVRIFRLLYAVAPSLCVRGSGFALRTTPHRRTSRRSRYPLSHLAYTLLRPLGASSPRAGQRLRSKPQGRTH